MTQAPGAITVRARIRLLTTAEGGRQTPVQGSGTYNPNHRFFEDDQMTMGFIGLPERTGLPLGETVETVVTFLPLDWLTDELYPGRDWRIQEGSHLVGRGTVIEVLD